MLWMERGYRGCVRLFGRVLIALVRFYQLFISPLKPPSCRFYPTCSSYMIEAIQVHGPLKGFWLGIKRLGKCHPLHPGGVDLVPPRLDAPDHVISLEKSKKSSCCGARHREDSL